MKFCPILSQTPFTRKLKHAKLYYIIVYRLTDKEHERKCALLFEACKKGDLQGALQYLDAKTVDEVCVVLFVIQILSLIDPFETIEWRLIA